MKNKLYSIKLTLLFCALFLSFKISATNYYWVGGGGNWSDINHWRTTSGGSGIPAVVPGSTDDVFFDANSGFTSGSKQVTINVAANCRNITVSGNAVPPTFLGTVSTNPLNIYGSAEWQAGMTYNISTTNYQNNNTSKTIKSNGVATAGANIVNFYETNTISLLDDFSVGSLRQYAGTWNTNNHRVDVQLYSAEGTSAKTLNLGSSQIYVNSALPYFKTNTGGTVLNAGTSHIHFTYSYATSSVYGIVGNPGQTFYDVTFENIGMSGTAIGGAGIASNPLKFHNVELKGGGYIYGSNIFNQLILAPTKTFYLAYSQTQTITSLLSLNTPDCAGWSTFQSTKEGTAATISMGALATVDVSGVVMKDVNASGGANFIANSSVDNGNNTGWTFPAYVGQNLYWVGGAGNWNDRTHWSQTSGGTGGYCVPGPGDNVFFDAGSGFTSSSKTVTVDAVSYCHDITVNGTTTQPTIVSSVNANTLNIYGSSEWQSGMTYSVYTTNYRDTNEAKTIKSNGVTTSASGYVNFYESSSISFLDDFKTNILNQYAGAWNTNGYRVDLMQYSVQGTLAKTLNLGSSQIYMNSGTSFFKTNMTIANVNAGTSHIHFTQAITSTSPSYGIIAQGGQTYYDVTFENPTMTGMAISNKSTSTSGNTVNFHNVELKGGGYIAGFNTFNQLILAPTKTFYLSANQTQTVTSLLSLNTPTCSGWSTLISETDGTAATISMGASATVDVSGVVMKDVNASGGANFIANSSVDNGNNTGWTFPAYVGQNLYWVGGAGNWNDRTHWSQTSGGTGGYCVPGPGDNVFFDAGSGFTSSSKTVTVDAVSYCHDITVNGTTTQPTIVSSVNTNTLNIYGSSEWQSGMTYSVYTTNYKNTGEAKTIKSNGVGTSASGGYVNFYEKNSLSLLDDFSVNILNQYAGTWNTNNHKVDINNSFYTKDASVSKTINLGTSEINLYGSFPAFDTSIGTNTLDAGTSHIHFRGGITSTTSNMYGILGAPGHVFYDVTYENPTMTGVAIGNKGTATNPVHFHNVVLKGNGYIYGNNVFNELTLLNSDYRFQANGTQVIISNLYASGNSCHPIELQSTTAGTQASLDVQGGKTAFNFDNVKDIKALSNTLYFGDKSTDDGNNMNLVFEKKNSGDFEGLGANWKCHVIDATNSDSYIVKADGFFGNAYTSYKWSKVGDANVTGIIGTSSTLDIQSYGYGTYHIEVSYFNDCTLTDDLTISPKTVVPTVNKNVCKKTTGNTLADVSVTGQDIKWYADNATTTTLPTTTVINDGETYYVSQTVDGCESDRVAVTLKMVNCNQPSMINPALPFWTK